MIKDRIRGILMLLPGIALIAAAVYAAEIRAPETALDMDSVRVISEAKVFDVEQSVNTMQKKPKINRSASSSAKGMAAGTEAPKPSGSKNISHDSSLDNADFRDGTYIGTARGFSGIVKVKVTISGGRIKSVDIISHSDTPSYFNRARKVASAIMAKQSTKVDSVSGATYSSNGIIKATENALRKAAGRSKKDKNKKKADKEKVSKKKYKDGVYTASAEGYHGPVTVKVTITNGRIAKVSIVSHTDTPSYFNRAKILTKKIKKYNRADVDAVTGATYSSRGIINAVKKALKKASGKNSGDDPDKPHTPDEPGDQVSDIKYEDGTYEGSAVGYTGGNGIVCMTYVTVTVSDNKISAIDVESQDPTLSGDDWYWTLVYPMIPDKIVKTNNPDVDTVSGATMSSKGIINAVKNALEGHELKENTDEDKGADHQSTEISGMGLQSTEKDEAPVSSDRSGRESGDEPPEEEAVIPEPAAEQEEKKKQEEQAAPPEDRPEPEVKEPEEKKEDDPVEQDEEEWQT